MATGAVWENCDWQHSMAHPRKPPPTTIFAKILQNFLTEAEL